ncbi:MAG: spermine synthase [Nitrospirota bacterium]
MAETTLAGGATLSLCTRDGQYSLRVGGRELMGTVAVNSELRLADLGCETLGTKRGARVLIGGLGLGFTLRRVLERVGRDARVAVAELLPAVVDWNRTYLQSINGKLLDDPRVNLMIEDVLTVLAHAKPGQYDVILLDVDNGPPASIIDPATSRLYADDGFAVVSRALRIGGRAVFWSASADRAFVKRLTKAGFRATAVGAKAHPRAKRDTHTLFVADWLGGQPSRRSGARDDHQRHGIG